MGRAFVVHAVGSTGKNDSLIACSLDFLRRNLVIGFDFRIDMMFPDSAGNQLVILTAKVQNKDFFFHLTFPHKLIWALSVQTPAISGLTFAKNASTCCSQRPM